MGKKYFTVLYIVSRNKYGVNITALINIGVNGFAFIDISYTNNITKFLNVKAYLSKRL